jgi:hypothetical protein
MLSHSAAASAPWYLIRADLAMGLAERSSICLPFSEARNASLAETGAATPRKAGGLPELRTCEFAGAPAREIGGLLRPPIPGFDCGNTCVPRSTRDAATILHITILTFMFILLQRCILLPLLLLLAGRNNRPATCKQAIPPLDESVGVFARRTIARAPLCQLTACHRVVTTAPALGTSARIPHWRPPAP